MINSRFLQVHPDAINEYIQDDQFFYEDEYSVINDIKNNKVSFTFSKNVNDVNNYNKIPNQLYLIDELINSYGIADPDNKQFLQETKYLNNQPSRFDKIKIWFPIHYTFGSNIGFYLNVYANNFDNSKKYNLSNFYLDITNPLDLNKLENESTPFRMNQRLWGKSITVLVPSLYDESRERLNNAPKPGTINSNLTSGQLGLSQTSPIYFDFRFINRKRIILNETTFILNPGIITSLSQFPEFNNIGVVIERSNNGDYFEINAVYNNSVSEFDAFMTTLEESGKRSYLLYSITTIEENIPTKTIDIYVYENFMEKVEFRPIFKFSNTIGSIKVDLKLINAIDGSVITKTAELTLLGNEVSKYGKYISSINLSNAIKPKIYNSAPTQIALPSQELLNSHLKRKAKNKIQLKYVPYPVLINSYNVVAKDVNVLKNNTTFLSNGNLTIDLTPFDNIIKLAIYNVDSNNDTIPFNIPVSNTIVNMVFKNNINELRIPLYIESNEVDLANGIVIFKIKSSEVEQLRNSGSFKSNFKFYITLTTNGIETSLYEGKYGFGTNLVSETRVPFTPSLINIPTFTTSPVNTEINELTIPNRINVNNLINSLQQVSLNTNQLNRLK